MLGVLPSFLSLAINSTALVNKKKKKNLMLGRFCKILRNGKWVVAAIGGEWRRFQAFAFPLWSFVYSRLFISIESRTKSKPIYHVWFKHWASCIENTSASCSRQEEKEQLLISYLPVFSVPHFIRACVVSTSFNSFSFQGESVQAKPFEVVWKYIMIRATEFQFGYVEIKMNRAIYFLLVHKQWRE